MDGGQKLLSRGQVQARSRMLGYASRGACPAKAGCVAQQWREPKRDCKRDLALVVIVRNDLAKWAKCLCCPSEASARDVQQQLPQLQARN